MIIKNLHRQFKHRPRLVQQTHYQQSRFEKLLFFIRKILNKMANEDNRTYNQKMMDSSVPMQPQKPQNQIQAEKLLLKNQQVIASHQKSRLKRIDEILGTKTYFHEIKPYQQRVDSQSIIQISKLYHKYKDVSRDEVDMLNPQIPNNFLTKKRRKHTKLLTKLKKYPKGSKDLVQFQQGTGDESLNIELINFLSEQTLYTRLALADLQLVIQSINKQRIFRQTKQQVRDNQMQQNYFIFNSQVYFRPHLLMSIYRINKDKFNQKLVSSAQYLAEAVTAGMGHIEQVITLKEIYQCLKNYYYDQRVSKYLTRIQNQQLQYFLSQLYISPDSSSLFVTIDLLGSQKEYVGLYKKLGTFGEENELILQQNVIFNIKSTAAVRNNGQVYCVQRNQQGMFNQFIKVKFNDSLTKQQTKQLLDQTYLQGTKKIEKYKRQRQQTIIYRCKPYQQLNILTNNAAISGQSSNIISQNILLSEKAGNQDKNNKIYLFLHQPGVMKYQNTQDNNIMQNITANNDNLKDLFSRLQVKEKFKDIDEWQTNPKNLGSQCFELIGIGFVIIRYEYVEGFHQNEFLKFGNNVRYTRYATLVPYSHTNIKRNLKDLLTQSNKNIIIKKQNQLTETPEKKQSQNNQDFISNEDFQIDLPFQQWNTLANLSSENLENYRLSLSDEYIIYVCPPQHFITDFRVKHSSISNVYLLINQSVQSVYNRNSLYVHPMRKNVSPYSIYLDGYPIQVNDKNTGTGDSTAINLKLLTPILSVDLKYTLWKRQIQQSLNNRVYTQTITIKQSQNGEEIIIKIVSGSKFIKRKKGQKHENQPTIIYLPSRDQRLDEVIVQKLMEKGVLFVQIVKCRGTFNTTMIDLIRGSKSFYYNFLQDVLETVLFAKQYISEHITIYAEGASSCFATLLLNIKYNQNNQLFDGCVLHEGVYDLQKISPQSEYFFGRDASIFRDINPLNFRLLDPTKDQKLEENQRQKQFQISSLGNMMVSTVSQKSRKESRKLINKLRVHNKIVFQTVFLKEFDRKQEKDLYNLAYLYKIMNEKMHTQYKQAQQIKYKEIKQKGQSLSRDSKDSELNKKTEDINK